ncbi:uncharacterized protein Dwil_GK21154 [Drosophila willistoni]|uniref:Uncharacterized protein n=1 Tax=Drosophila willistoni TaxID=7260 RepID=B4MXZ1_DROWI|nr:uncharacterized protein LOC6643063 [Drosophila willistoni]EDW76980.1 uncharacterized protein Dwil_GK21154 [Drosophila willistoni]
MAKRKKGKKGKKKVDCKIKITPKMLQPENPPVEDECEECCQCQCDCDCSPEIQPCFIQPTRPEPGPEAYDEFEACLNGSGLTIRVLKNTHKVESVDDGAQSGANLGADDECLEDCDSHQPNGLHDIMQRSNFARNHIKRRTGGKIINHPNIPKIRANIKYSGNDTCEAENFNVPFSKIKEACEAQEAKVECYRQRLCGGSQNMIVPAHPPQQNQRNCCLQVDKKDIMQTMKGVNQDTRKKGIEVCYKTCDETDSDVFLVKLGSKAKSQHKKNTIEIELRTPKLPANLPQSKVTTETYVTEALLDAGKKGKKGKKGKGKGKKKK